MCGVGLVDVMLWMWCLVYQQGVYYVDCCQYQYYQLCYYVGDEIVFVFGWVCQVGGEVLYVFYDLYQVCDVGLVGEVVCGGQLQCGQEQYGLFDGVYLYVVGVFEVFVVVGCWCFDVVFVVSVVDCEYGGGEQQYVEQGDQGRQLLEYC